LHQRSRPGSTTKLVSLTGNQSPVSQKHCITKLCRRGFIPALS